MQFAPDASVYVNELIDDVQSFYTDTQREDDDDNIGFSEVKRDLSKVHKNSLGIVMEEKRGVFLSIIKGTFSKNYSRRDHTILRKNYMNLEEIISEMMKSDRSMEPEK